MPSSLPHTPKEWETYAQSYSIPSLPAKDFNDQDKQHPIQRDVYVNASQILSSPISMCSVFADVLAFSNTAETIHFDNITKSGLLWLFARQITSDKPTTLDIVPASVDSVAVLVYASFLDQPLFVTVNGKGTPKQLDLGPGSGHVGVIIVVANGSVELQYQTKYTENDFLRDEQQLVNLLTTQLRITNIVFWRSPELAISLAVHIASVTFKSTSGALLNLQATALLRQIRASTAGGPGLSYAPVLTLKTYLESLTSAIETASAFQTQYDRFSDRKSELKDKQAAWDVMYQRAEDALRMQTKLAEDAEKKWASAEEIVRQSVSAMKVHQFAVQDKAIDFSAGVEEWKIKTILKAVADILTAVVTFAFAIGTICLGDPAAAVEAPAAAAKAAKAVEDAAKAAKDSAKVTSDTIKKLSEVCEALHALYEATSKEVSIIKTAQDAADFKPSDDPDGGNLKGDADLNAIVTLAGWDKWVLESDAQLEFALKEGIGGAAEYQLELRKHAVDGKLVSQARAQAVKAGQEYVQYQLALRVAQADVKRIQALREQYKGTEEETAKAQAHFYDRLMAVRTSVVIELRNAVWAYRFYGLEDLSLTTVMLDPLKRIEDYRLDKLTLQQAIEAYEEKFASDPNPYLFKFNSNNFGLGVGAAILDSLKKNHTATFTLSPPSDMSSTALCGPFKEGSHYRTSGMRAFLIGVKFKSTALNKDAEVDMSVRTTGIYLDIADNNAVWAFTMKQLAVRFSYVVTGTNPEDIRIDSVQQNIKHTDPTPFTQWTIELKNPQELDLSGLTGVRLEWKGTAYFKAR